ncbi:MAG TPA: hypothetical protein VGV89_09945 [Thermoplasmata archaeon]|nr:hypothetical protein [Thermoplasmata archaeon]
MQSLSPREREGVPRRRARSGCALCGRFIDLNRLRSHLRDVHHLDSAQLDQILADARRIALRGRSRGSSYSTG